jgi:putative addiction module killer protein
MYSIIETEQFAQWLGNIKDRLTRARLQLRLRKASLGNLGDNKTVGDNVWEMREFFWSRVAHVLHFAWQHSHHDAWWGA